MKKMLNYDNWEDVKKELLAQPGFKEALKETELEFQVARAIIEARVKKGMTQADLARAMNTKQSVISRAENAKTVPSLSFLRRLAKVLDKTVHVEFKT